MPSRGQPQAAPAYDNRWRRRGHAKDVAQLVAQQVAFARLECHRLQRPCVRCKTGAINRAVASSANKGFLETAGGALTSLKSSDQLATAAVRSASVAPNTASMPSVPILRTCRARDSTPGSSVRKRRMGMSMCWLRHSERTSSFISISSAVGCGTGKRCRSVAGRPSKNGCARSAAWPRRRGSMPESFDGSVVSASTLHAPPSRADGSSTQSLSMRSAAMGGVPSRSWYFLASTRLKVR